MEKSAIYHRPDSEMAYLKTANIFQIRLKTKHLDAVKVELLFGDPYDVTLKKDGGVEWQHAQHSLKKVAATLTHDYWEIDVRLPLLRLQYAFKITDNEGKAVFYDSQKIVEATDDEFNQLAFFCLPWIDPREQVIPPQWVRKQIWYQIDIKHFASTSYEEQEKTGTFKGLIAKLDYLKHLGITGINLQHIFKWNFGEVCNLLDYFEVNPKLGTKADLKALVLEAHKRGLKVMLDMTLPYTTDKLSQWQELVENNENSRYLDWFKVQSLPVGYEKTVDENIGMNFTYAVHGFNPHLPKFNLKNHHVKTFLQEVLAYWVKNFEIDAYRLEDAAEIDRDFLSEIHNLLNLIKPDFYVAGVVHSAQPRLMEGNGCDGTTNASLVDAIISYGLDKTISIRQLISQINENTMRYRDQTLPAMLNELPLSIEAKLQELAFSNPQAFRQLLAFLFFQKGAPSILFGTEITSKAQTKKESDTLNWDEASWDETNFAFLQILINLRKHYSTLFEAGRLSFSKTSKMHQYLMLSVESQNEKLLALFNFGQTEIQCVLPKHHSVLLSQNASADYQKIKGQGFLILEV